MVLYYDGEHGMHSQKVLRNRKLVADKGCPEFAHCEGIVLLDVTDAVLQRKKGREVQRKKESAFCCSLSSPPALMPVMSPTHGKQVPIKLITHCVQHLLQSIASFT